MVGHFCGGGWWRLDSRSHRTPLASLTRHTHISQRKKCRQVCFGHRQDDGTGLAIDSARHVSFDVFSFLFARLPDFYHAQPHFGRTNGVLSWAGFAGQIGRLQWPRAPNCIRYWLYVVYSTGRCPYIQDMHASFTVALPRLTICCQLKHHPGALVWIISPPPSLPLC